MLITIDHYNMIIPTTNYQKRIFGALLIDIVEVKENFKYNNLSMEDNGSCRCLHSFVDFKTFVVLFIIMPCSLYSISKKVVMKPIVTLVNLYIGDSVP